ncbi:hypothetical protein evm_014384 [Chilo suppressalis]|nr:hypothetical protein evm_014384 [Chilo suppressalis]
MGCESRRKDVAFYKIPKSETGLLWLKHLQNSNSVQRDKCFVCAKHFEKRCFTSSRLRSRLHSSAIPTLFTESEINNAVPDATGKVTSATELLMDHDYSRKRKHQVDHSYCKVDIVNKQMQPQTVTDKKAEDSTPRAELPAENSKHSEDIAEGLVSEPLKPKATYRNPIETIEEYLSDFESGPECQPETESQEDTATDDTSDHLLLCRGCFATDVKMFDLDSMDLKQTFEEFVGKTVSVYLYLMNILRE